LEKGTPSIAQQGECEAKQHVTREKRASKKKREKKEGKGEKRDGESGHVRASAAEGRTDWMSPRSPIMMMGFSVYWTL